MNMRWKNWGRSTKGAVIGAIIGGGLGTLVALVIGFSQEAINVIEKLFLLGLISGGLLSWADHKSERIKKPLKETYAWIGSVVGVGIFLIPTIAKTVGLLSMALLSLPMLFLETHGIQIPILWQTLFWILHLTLGGILGYTVGYFIKRKQFVASNITLMS